MKRDELLVIAAELILDEPVLFSRNKDEFAHKLFLWLDHYEYKSRQKRLSAIERLNVTNGLNSGETYAASPPADQFVNRPGGVLTRAVLDAAYNELVLGLDPALPDADRSLVMTWEPVAGAVGYQVQVHGR